MKRGPFQGVYNILCFNSHTYFLTAFSMTVFFGCMELSSPEWRPFLELALILMAFSVLNSLLIAHYIYDRSNVYCFHWLPNLNQKKVLNIHAGFDESSPALKHLFPGAQFQVCDFYNPQKHTEPSIRKARRMYPNPPEVVPISTDHIPFPNQFFHDTTLIFAAHEIREKEERVAFFKEVNRVTEDRGCVWVLEHLRDWKNGWAFNLGFLHFFARKHWLETFDLAHFQVVQEWKVTPFISAFKLKKHGATP